MNRHQQHFIDANERLWNDALFIDGIHLNKEGAAAFTQYSLSKAKKQINE